MSTPIRKKKSTRRVADSGQTGVKQATKAQLQQASRVRKQIETQKQKEQKEKERFRTGKKMKKEKEADHKPSIWEKIAEDKMYHQLREMGNPTNAIDKFQKNRVLSVLFFILLGIIAGSAVHQYLYIAGPLVGFLFYKRKAKKVDTYYKGWKFQRQLNFSKFTRLVIPYLKASGGTAALYTIFNKILQRTEDETDKQSLYQLMGEMGDNPSDLKPFTDFAERMSGTDMSHLFMSTIFDFQQSTFDVSVIDELGHMASEDMMNAIDEIIEMKIKRFVMFPTKVVMSSFILVAGLGVGLMLDKFSELDFSSEMMDPQSQVSQEANTKEKKEKTTPEKAKENEKTKEKETMQQSEQMKSKKSDEKPMSEAEKLYNKNILEIPEKKEKDVR